MNSRKHTGKNKGASSEEQAICVSCGFCCDGTLFMNAGLNPGERGQLPEMIEQESFSDGDKEYFRLPCHYFCVKCTIYNLKRADVCSSYRCQLLRDLAEGRITLDDTVEIVREARRMRKIILKEYGMTAEKKEDIPFRRILIETGRKRKDPSPGNSAPDHEILIARCNIFESLLIKHFRSADAFEKMIIQ
ncbi:MAG: hypothetical protein P1P83_14050 [Bacteroidales bacterium]|nr:hypothetical protein [Bacteroidales bacterium]MDT8375056.1 hypothetical protein [Bacteroidales bacterium]